MLNPLQNCLPNLFVKTFCALGALVFASCHNQTTSSVQSIDANCNTTLVVLGTAQDAGKPQISVHNDAAWTDPSKTALAVSLGLIDREAKTRYLFDASPDMKQQLYDLDQLDDGRGFALDGVFLTHGHMGHYLGLAHLGREAMGAKSIPVYAMPKMAEFLESNGPWNQLVELNNIDIRRSADGELITLNKSLDVMPFAVPHRGEYTETVGYRIAHGNRSAIYLPDIDSWTEWEAAGGSLERLVEEHDRLYLDATFFSGAELPGRDMSLIPHPTISTTMAALAHLSIKERNKVRFIHLNHSNPAHNRDSAEFREITEKGFGVAEAGETFCLDAS